MTSARYLLPGLADFLIRHPILQSAVQCALWQEELGPGDVPSGLMASLILVQEEISPSSYQIGLEAMRHACCDLLNVREQFQGGLRIEVEFVILHLSSWVMFRALIVGDYPSVYDWVIRSLGDFPSVPRTSVTTGLDDRMMPIIFSLSRFVVDHRSETLMLWMKAYLAYVEHFPIMHEYGAAIYPHVYADVVQMAKDPRAPNSGFALEVVLQLLSWASKYESHSVAGMLRRVMELAQDPWLPRTHLRRMLLTLSREWDGQDKQTSEIFGRVGMRLFGNKLTCEERIVLWENIVAVAAKLRDDDIVRFVESIVEYEDGSGRAGLASREVIEVFSRVAGSVMRLLARGAVQEAHRVLAVWFGVPPSACAQMIYVSPYLDHRRGLISSHGTVLSFERNRSAGDFNEASNRMFGTTSVIRGDASTEMLDPERPGIPDQGFARQFLSVLSDFVNIPELIRRANLQPSADAMFSFMALRVPLQAAVIAGGGPALPLRISHQLPQPDRAIRRVLIWGADSIADAFHEVDAVKRVFEECRVSVSLVAPADMSHKAFSEIYRSDDYDVIWIVAHGCFDQCAPEQSHLQLSGSERAYARDFISPRSTGRRRLLVLNSCDGVTADMHGTVGRMGIAAHASCASQAVVSHVMPVHSLVGAAFGCLLAASLGLGAGFFDSWEYAVKVLRGGQDMIVADLSAWLPRDSDVLRRVFNASMFQDERFCDWGSSVFLE